MHNKNIEEILKKTGINIDRTNLSLKKMNKIINSSKLILDEKIFDLEKLNNFFAEKIPFVEKEIRLRYKRNTQSVFDLISLVKEEFNFLFNKLEKFFLIDVILNKLFYDIKIKFDVKINFIFFIFLIFFRKQKK